MTHSLLFTAAAGTWPRISASCSAAGRMSVLESVREAHVLGLNARGRESTSRDGITLAARQAERSRRRCSSLENGRSRTANETPRFKLRPSNCGALTVHLFDPMRAPTHRGGAESRRSALLRIQGRVNTRALTSLLRVLSCAVDLSSCCLCWLAEMHATLQILLCGPSAWWRER